MVLEIKKCRNCGHPIAKLNGEWWHYGEVNGKFKEHDGRQINFNKAQLLEIKNIKCKECQNETTKINYCFKPEPFVE